MKFYREKFRELRKTQRWTIKALSEAANISRESISKWENGQREPSAKSMYLLARTIGVRVSEFSSLDDLYPKSETKVSDIVITDNCNLLESIDNEENSYLNNILANLKNMNNNLKRVSSVLRTILVNVNNIIYIKDVDQKYVLVSKAFLDNSSLSVDYISKGKSDLDFFPANEAAANTKEDEKIFATGEPIINAERHIPGSRKKKWGIFNKIPILDSKKKMKGLLCVIVDITDRRKQEKYSQILEYAFSQSKTTIWVGKGVDLSDSPMLCKEIVYWRSSENSLLGNAREIEKYKFSGLRTKWFQSVSTKAIERFVKEKKKFKYPQTRFYLVTSPFNGNRVWIKERIFFDNENETFVGLLTEDSDSLKLGFLSRVIESMSNIVVWCGYYSEDNEFNFTYINNTLETTGYPKEDFLDGKISFDKLALEEHKELFHYLQEINRYPISFEFKIKDKNSKEHWMKGNFFKDDKFEESDFTIYYGYYIDVSEEKYLEESLRDIKFKELGIDN